jgi:hypothetical protein
MTEAEYSHLINKRVSAGISGVVAITPTKSVRLHDDDPEPLEDEEQATVAQFLDLILPDSVRWFHVPNGGNRDPREAAKLKRHGVKAGIPDIMILGTPPNFPGSPGAAIELKRRKSGRVSDDQKDWIEFLENRGFCCQISRGAPEAINFIMSLGWK